VSACYSIARNLLALPSSDLKIYDELREMRNVHYGHLNLLEIENATYATVLLNLKRIVNELTQNNTVLQQEANIKIQKFESIKELSSLSEQDMSNFKEIIGDILKNRDIFMSIGKFNVDFEEFSRNYEQAQLSSTSKLDELRILAVNLRKLSKSIMDKQISQDEIEQIADCVSSHLKMDRLKLEFEATLVQQNDLIKRDIDNAKKTILVNMNRIESKVDQMDEQIKRQSKLFFNLTNIFKWQMKTRFSRVETRHVYETRRIRV
jgi:hypothetical protein